MEVEEFDFAQPEDNYTFNHVIALGDRAGKTLRQLRIDLGSWFVDELLTIKEGCEGVRYLIAIVDNDMSLFDVPERYTDSEFVSHNLLVLDIGDKPQKRYWKGVYSYIWIPEENQYTTVSHFFQMYYHDVLTYGSLVCFDFNDWKYAVRGMNRMKIYRMHLDENASRKLKTWPTEALPKGKYIAIIGTHTFEKEQMTSLMNSVNTLFERFSDDAILHWTILGKELPEQDAYISLMQFTPF